MRSVRTTFKILETVASRQPIGLSELSRTLAMPKSTVQRSLATLGELDWIRSDEDSKWVLGAKVSEVGKYLDEVSGLRDAALSAMGDLHAETNETIHLSVLDGRFARLVERYLSTHALRLVKPLGSRAALHAASSGKAILAGMPSSRVEEYVRGGLPRVTSRTLTDPVAFRVELECVRSRGYAISEQEMEDGIVSVAAAIRAPTRRPIAALAVAVPLTRVDATTRETLGRMVIAAAEDVEANLSQRSR